MFRVFRGKVMTAQAIEAVEEWLAKAENADAEWLLGNVLRERMRHSDYLENPAIQVIASGQGGPLAAVIKAVRGHAKTPDDLRAKLAQELNPKKRFRQQNRGFLGRACVGHISRQVWIQGI